MYCLKINTEVADVALRRANIVREKTMAGRPAIFARPTFFLLFTD